ncbi:hypothetical protein HWI79_2238 [Cryptosporidium felis]|nr:hypothetical protein HWI79_2238 [Cryptosporidium felis]
MDVNSSTNRVEAERCLDLLVNQLISSQYWQGSIRSQQIENSIALFHRYLRLSNEQNVDHVIQELRNKVGNQPVVDDFIRKLETGNNMPNVSRPTVKDKLIHLARNLSKLHLFVIDRLYKLESIFFNFLPEGIRNSILPSYRKPLFLLYLLNFVLFVARLSLFNSKPIIGGQTKTNNYSGEKLYYAFNNYEYPAFLDVIYETFMFFLNILTSIIPLVLPVVTLNFLNGQYIQG